jgi:spermidine/putrescine transport system substrate-binding protein
MEEPVKVARIGRRGNAEAILAVLAARGIDRRQFLQRMGAAGVLAIGGPALLAACGGGEGSESTASTPSELFVDNWIEYIDIDEAGGYPTILKFTQATGIEVNYAEGVNTNEDWFGKYQPQLAAGQPIGIDVAMITDYMAAKMIRLGYLEKIDKANVPNAVNLVDALKSPSFDPNRDYTLPWQSYFTMIGYDIDQTERELTSVSDLLDPAFAGKVGLLEGYTDTVPFFLLMQGKNPDTASVDEWVAASADIKKAIDSGQIRDVYGNDYLDALLNGDLAVSLAYSGDIIANQADNPQLRALFPIEGFVVGTDNMLIPKGAANKAGAEKWMNHYYDPVIAAELAAFISYMSPVNGAREAMESVNPSLVNDPFIFPDEATLAKAHIAPVFTEEEENAVNEALAAAMGV